MQEIPSAPSASARRALIDRLRGAGCVFAEDEADLLIAHVTAEPRVDMATLVAQRVAGMPLEHVVGWAEFAGGRIVVEPGVFVPRPRSEFLVDHAARLIGPMSVVVDLCCGSGAIGTALVRRVGSLVVHAVDIDETAVRCARRNLEPLGATVHLGDLDAPLPGALRGRVDLVVANAPYVPTAAIGLLPHEARDHEPLVALDGGVDGIRIQQRVTAAAARLLAPGGHLVMETNEAQSEGSAALTRAVGLTPEVLHSADGEAFVVVARRPPDRG